MKRYSKNCEESSRAAQEMQISLYSVYGKEYHRDTELPENSSSLASLATSGCCKYDEPAKTSRLQLRSPDLEDAGRGISTTADVKFSREANSSFEIGGDSRPSMATEKTILAVPAAVSPRRKPPVFAAKTPSEAELEEFFTEAEEYVQKRFAQKYNYDIVKDAPIVGGRFFPERATSLAFAVLNELVKELRGGLCPVVLATFPGGSKACMYKILQIIEGCSEVELNMEDRRLVAGCISGQIYNSDPIDFTTDLGARFALHHSILKMPGASKLASFLVKGVTSSLDALFLTRFGSQQAEYWQTLYSSVHLGAPFLIICSEDKDMDPFSTVCTFAKHLLEVGGDVKIIKRTTSFHLGHHQHQSTTQCTAINKLLEQAVSIFSEKIRKLGEISNIEDMHDGIPTLISDLQNAAVVSDQSFRRVSSLEYEKSREFESVQEQKERSPLRTIPRMCTNTVLGQILFDACVPKNVEGWDIRFSGTLNGEPFASVSRRSPFCVIKNRSRL